MKSKHLYNNYTLIIPKLYKMAVEVVLKKWGNSYGVVLPKDFVKNKKLKMNQKIKIELVEEADLTDIFGSLKRKMSGQEFKDMVREGWD